MNAKTKFTLIVGGIIAFFGGWIVLVMSLIPNNNTDIKNPRDLRFQSDTIGKAPTTGNKIENNKKEDNKKDEDKKDEDKKDEDKKIEENKNNGDKIVLKEKHNLKILTPEINSKTAWKIFNNKYNKITSGEIQTIYYNNIEEYNKELIYKLATKSNDFDLAIIPAEWFKNTEELSKLSFNLQNASFQISSLFDYNFQEFLKNNNIKAIPFSIDPIIGFTSTKEIKTIQNFDSWKKIIINSYNRIDKNGKLKYMPLFLGYDKNYLNYIEKNKKSIFPIFDYITKFYKYKKERTGISLIKDFGQNITYKTFDFNLYKKNLIKFRKDSLCKGDMGKYCLLFNKKTKLVYGFSSDSNFLKENGLNIFKKFKIRTKKLNLVTLPIGNSQEYPSRGWIIIINPNSKNLKYIGTFLKAYINMGKKGELPFYKNMISPFLSQSLIKNPKINFLSNYNGKFITLDKFGVGIKDTLDKKIINYLKGDISIDILLR